MKRIREGNDFDVTWAIKRAGVPEDFSTAIEKRLTMVVYGNVIEHSLYTITDNILAINVPKEVAHFMGDYRLVFEYTLPDLGQPDGDLKCKTDVVAFRIVPLTADADIDMTVDVASDVAIGFKGDEGNPGVDAYQIWLDMGNTGTYDDYLTWQRAPAVDAAATANAAAILANTKAGEANNAAASANSAAGLANTRAGEANTAAGLANEAAQNANSQAVLANEKAILANEAAQAANEAAVLANEKAGNADSATTAANEAATLANTKAEEARNAASLANEKAELANTKAIDANNAAQLANEAAGLADDARLAIQDDLATKADHGYDTTPKTLKEVDDSVLSDEEVVATDLNALAERINALEKAFRNSIFNKVQTDTLDVLVNLNFQGRPLFIVSNVAPAIIPDGVPQFYVNTATGDFYSAKNNTSVNDWILK
jgi:hypothetical protein